MGSATWGRKREEGWGIDFQAEDRNVNMNNIAGNGAWFSKAKVWDWGTGMLEDAHRKTN